MRFLTVAVILLCAMTSRAEEFFSIWPDGKMPFAPKKNQTVGEETESEKGIVKGVSVPGFEVFLPTNGAKRSMAVLICPGGAYGCLDYDREG